MYLYGAGGHARVIIDILHANQIEVKALIDDNPLIDTFSGIPVYHSATGMSPIIVSVGDNRIRKNLAEHLSCEFGIALHPSAILSPDIVVGKGSVVMQGAILQAGVSIGCHCIVNTGASIDHECVIEDYVHISPHSTLCGNVHVGEGSWIGASSTIIPGVHIGKWSIVGAGSVVIRDIPDNVIAYGNPCKIIQYSLDV